jgi:hypothetical protein
VAGEDGGRLGSLVAAEVNRESALLGHKLGEVDGKAVRVVQAPGKVAGKNLCS